MVETEVRADLREGIEAHQGGVEVVFNLPNSNSDISQIGNYMTILTPKVEGVVANQTGEVEEDAPPTGVEEEEVEETKTEEEEVGEVEGHAPECHHFLQLNAGL